MTAWLTANLANILLVAALILVVTLILVKLVKDKKKGRSSCGCGCEHCAMRDACHQKAAADRKAYSKERKDQV